MSISDPFEKLVECHDHITTRLSLFGKSLQAIETHGMLGFVSEKENIQTLFDFMDTSISLHTRDEEEGLFPTLRPKLDPKLDERGGGRTPVDVMKSEHRIVEDVAARMKTLAPLIEREAKSSDVSILLDEFLEKGRWLIKAYHQHIWKENNVLFPMAERLLSATEKTEVASVMNNLRKQTIKA